MIEKDFLWLMVIYLDDSCNILRDLLISCTRDACKWLTCSLALLHHTHLFSSWFLNRCESVWLMNRCLVSCVGLFSDLCFYISLLWSSSAALICVASKVKLYTRVLRGSDVCVSSSQRLTALLEETSVFLVSPVLLFCSFI